VQRPDESGADRSDEDRHLGKGGEA
jgi:hypothetical protein